jgi:putative addiction module component (TIGR02574 family)
MSSTNAVLAAAMKLPREERADLARELIASLDEEVEAAGGDVEAAWLAEVERRQAAMDHRTAKLEPWDDVHDRIAARLRDMRR